MNKFTGILTSVLLCYPFNYGTCIYIPPEEMDAPLQATKKIDRSKLSSEDLDKAMKKSVQWSGRFDAEKCAIGFDYYIKKPLYAAALQKKMGRFIELPDETKDKIAQAKEKAKEKIEEFLNNRKYVPFAGMRAVKHLFNTYTEIEDLIDYLNGEEAIKIEWIIPSVDFKSHMKNPYGRFYAIQKMFQDVDLGDSKCFLNGDPHTLGSIEYEGNEDVSRFWQVPEDTKRYDEWTPTQAIWDWATIRKLTARKIAVASKEEPEDIEAMEILSNLKVSKD